MEGKDTHMTAEEIAETLVNGNRTDAYNEILRGRSQAEAVVMALDVLIALNDYDTHERNIRDLRRLMAR